jgi:hypothetical protein
MKSSLNVWGIKEFEGDGKNCPIVPRNLPLYKRFVLFFFRFGVCPICVMSSVGYSLRKLITKS